MESEITLYKSQPERAGYSTITIFTISSVALLAAFCAVVFLLFTNQNFFYILISILVLLGVSVFLYASVKILISCIAERMKPVEEPVKKLTISSKGIFNHRTERQLIWEEISEIQVIDSMLSVTVDPHPEKDFQLNLSDTDVYKQMTRADFENLLKHHYKKEIYTYYTPPSCGCGG
ncbi:hypothetical protein [Chryseobacterium jejuense]|uniref:YcxB-like protein domain-containing protein n=1 Tax=Chryseobacterium jejuense TaxID=445960 RepID=A0A2X2XCR9_CHRJE|nr:hypothetical protein [Chryseobacterium jejuense]SDJ36261.1 hypothetical protein SAMN05421542_3310 [Chryseobacterium jejuense]SQB45815.1 Uncharacterised protein [Chryseobacterium jejuense]